MRKSVEALSIAVGVAVLVVIMDTFVEGSATSATSSKELGRKKTQALNSLCHRIVQCTCLSFVKPAVSKITGDLSDILSIWSLVHG